MCHYVLNLPVSFSIPWPINLITEFYKTYETIEILGTVIKYVISVLMSKITCTYLKHTRSIVQVLLVW